MLDPKTVELFNRLLQYLVTRPWGEVNALILAIQGEAQRMATDEGASNIEEFPDRRQS